MQKNREYFEDYITETAVQEWKNCCLIYFAGIVATGRKLVFFWYSPIFRVKFSACVYVVLNYYFCWRKVNNRNRIIYTFLKFLRRFRTCLRNGPSLVFRYSGERRPHSC